MSAMLGIILVVIGTILDEIATSSGKWNVNNKKESIYTMGFLNLIWVFIIFTLMILVSGNFIYNPNTIFLLALLTILEIIQAYSTLHAIVEAERSTFGFLMVGTIPLLLLVDIYLGYPIDFSNMIGISFIVISLLFLFINHGLSKKGIQYVLFSTFNAVITISLYKYLITNGNSVTAVQFVLNLVLLVCLYFMAIWKYKENPLKFMFKKRFIYQSISKGFSAVFIGFAYIYAPASVITGAKRGASVLTAMVSGNKYFHEKHLVIKIISFTLVVLGLILLVR
jgi:hypothetical protein